MTDTGSTAETDLLLAKRRLADILGHADDEALLLAIWGMNALQTGNPEGGGVFPFGHPPELVTQGMETGWAVHPWELETLANELLASPKSTYRTTPCNRWETVPTAVNLLRRIDDLEYVADGEHGDVFRELFRIGGRQFDWQRGYFNPAQFYRNVFIYGQGLCGEYFEERHGMTVNDLTMVGFAMYAGLVLRPNFMADGDFELLGVAADVRDKALDILAAPLADLRELAARERAEWETMAYRPSVLRRFPCVRFGRRGRRIRAPLPALILERITSGLFYDVVAGGGAMRDDYGRRFERYAIRCLDAMLPELVTAPESRYRVSRSRTYDTPDVIVSENEGEEVDLAIECKASRMSFGARFADEPTAERGYDDIVKAVFQLWRYFSHCRRGFTGRTAASDAIGLVLTLDGWMVMATDLFDEILERAECMARDGDPLIEMQDRRPIAFCSIPDFEAAASMGTASTFLAALRSAAERNHRGGYVQHRHEAILGPDSPRRGYPFDDLATMLPWWRMVEDSVPV